MAAGRIRPWQSKHGPRWQAIVELGRDEAGNRHTRSRMCRTEREARKALAQMMVEADRGTLSRRNRDTVGQLAQAWLDTHARFKSGKTFEEYSRSVRLYVLPYLGTVRLSDLKPGRVRSWVTELRVAGKGHRTVELALLVLRQALAQAVEDGEIPLNPALKIVVPAPEDRGSEHRTWTPEEARKVVATARAWPTYGPIFLLALSTGMRRGELLGLRWQDVDWETRHVYVRQAVGPEWGVIKTKQLKNKKARRDILVSKAIMEALKEHRTRQTEWRLRLGQAWEDNDLVFCSDVGTPINPSNLWRYYQKIVERAGVPYIRIHDQRHTHITWALEEHQDLKTVSERAGHSSVAITANIYQRVTRKLQDEVVEATDAKLFGTP